MSSVLECTFRLRGEPRTKQVSRPDSFWEYNTKGWASPTIADPKTIVDFCGKFKGA